ncbi:hypothetical protein BT96DRAFT_943645 [Gymnopus androsaceus JB14]|uniref:Uncharacterized protein n=1 Tax=Gymnopus androsaceus JB14 TaxID=1447944 RepID=A0A6A4H9E9_9AGAR|nr:hypothetical protein BT96DRAFT_943645 [Gymnopus androsaceus JB14]
MISGIISLFETVVLNDELERRAPTDRVSGRDSLVFNFALDVHSLPELYLSNLFRPMSAVSLASEHEVNLELDHVLHLPHFLHEWHRCHRFRHIDPAWQTVGTYWKSFSTVTSSTFLRTKTMKSTSSQDSYHRNYHYRPDRRGNVRETHSNTEEEQYKRWKNTSEHLASQGQRKGKMSHAFVEVENETIAGKSSQLVFAGAVFLGMERGQEALRLRGAWKESSWRLRSSLYSLAVSIYLSPLSQESIMTAHFLKVPLLPFHSLISIFAKFPADIDLEVFWTSFLRDLLFDAVFAAIQVLVALIDQRKNEEMVMMRIIGAQNLGIWAD